MFIIIVFWLSCNRPYGFSTYILHLFLYLISFLLFRSASVWKNTRAWVPHFLKPYWMVPYFFAKRHDRNGWRVVCQKLTIMIFVLNAQYGSVYPVLQILGWPQKNETKADWVLAQMFLIVGARFHHSWIGRKEVRHAWFVCEIDYQNERFLCRCLINRQNFSFTWARNAQLQHYAKGLRCASKCLEGHQTVTGARPHRWQSEKQQTVREATPFETASSSKKASNEIRQCLCEKFPAKPISRSNRSAE